VAKWWIPERWTFVDEIPRTSVGKYNKKALRVANVEGDLDVILSEAVAGSAATTRE
jgi:fatty-acyl-CoA synthase